MTEHFTTSSLAFVCLHYSFTLSGTLRISAGLADVSEVPCGCDCIKVDARAFYGTPS